MQDLLSRPQEEIKEEIRQQFKEKRKREMDEARLADLRAEVEVEELWGLYNPTKEQQKSLNRWLQEASTGNHKKYLELYEELQIPSVTVQMTVSTDEYMKVWDSYKLNWKWVEKAQVAQDKKDNRIAAFLTVGSIVGFIGLIFLAIHLLG